MSNNSSAVENVAEKLEGENLGFIVAKLGSVQNKEAFTANQPDCPDMSGWVIEEEPVRQQVQDALHAVTQGFDAQMRQARLKAEAEIGQELGDIAKTLQSIDIKRCTAELRSASSNRS